MNISGWMTSALHKVQYVRRGIYIYAQIQEVEVYTTKDENKRIGWLHTWDTSNLRIYNYAYIQTQIHIKNQPLPTQKKIEDMLIHVIIYSKTVYIYDRKRTSV